MILMEAFLSMPVSHVSNEGILVISLFTVKVKRYVCLKIDIKKLLHLYFLSKFSEINFLEGGCGDPSKDISTSRAMACFKRCIEKHANVIATMSRPESAH